VTTADGFNSVWLDTDPFFRVTLGLAWDSLVRRGLPVGAAISTGAGEVLSTGRNRVYDARGGADPLQRTPIAHAEMNALASIPHGADLSGCIIYSTHRPCRMCDAAILFSEVGETRFLASDPSDVSPGETYSYFPGTDPRLGLAANVMFLHNVAAVAGPDSDTVVTNRIGEPEAVELALTLAERRTWSDHGDLSVEQAIGTVWTELSSINRNPPMP